MKRGSLFGRPEHWESSAFALEEIEDPTSEGGSPISIRSLKSVLRRRRRLWCTAAVAGLLVGAALHVVLPRKYPVVTKLYLVESSSQGMSDDVALLQTHAVADRAITVLHSRGGGGQTLSAYKGTAISPSILQIKLSASSPDEAVVQSSALAPAFLVERSAVLNQQTQVLVNSLQAQISAINKQIQQLTDEIKSLPSGPFGSDSSRQANLINQRNGDSGQLTQLQNQVEAALNKEASITQGSRIVDPPSYVPASRKKVVIKDGLTGLVAGLALGIAITLIGEMLSDRVRRRAEVAAALGAPVELSVGRLPQPRWFVGPRLRRAVQHPSPALARVEHRLRSQLESNPVRGLSVIEIGSAKPAAVALTAIALSLASEGKRVMLFDAADGRPLATLFRKKRRSGETEVVSVDGHELALRVAPDDPTRIAWTNGPKDVDVVLTLATVDPAIGAEHMSTSVSEAVVMIRAGATSALRTNTVGQLLRQAIIGVRSAILIDADPDDHGLGVPGGSTDWRFSERSIRPVEVVDS